MRAGNKTLRIVSRKSPRNARIAVAVIAPISWGRYGRKMQESSLQKNLSRARRRSLGDGAAAAASGCSARERKMAL